MILSVEDLCFSYNGRPVLQHITLNLTSGELVGVIGPNGAGKSTLIRCLSRMLEPTHGRILIDGQDIHHLDRMALARIIAVVPQSPLLPDNFTALDLVLLGRTPHLGFLDSERPRDYAMARWAMEVTDTWSLAQRLVGKLSGGERQRLVLARALAQEPRLLLLDEPTAHLDLSHQSEIMDIVAGLVQTFQMAVLMAVHDLNLASQYCSRLILLHQGRAITEGAPVDVLTVKNLKAAFQVDATIIPHPANGRPTVLMAAQGRAHPQAILRFPAHQEAHHVTP